MINNHNWAVFALISAASLGCQSRPGGADESREYSGLAEFEERVLSFELGGRLLERPIERGQAVEGGALLASPDRGLDEAVLTAQRGQVEAASAQVAVLESGSKGEDIRAQSERVEAAKSQETLARESFERDSRLVESGALPSAILSERRAQLDRASAERKSLEAQLASLRRGARKEDVSAVKAQEDAIRAGLTLTDEK